MGDLEARSGDALLVCPDGRSCWQPAKHRPYDSGMLLDSLKLKSLHFQVRYDPAFELWDEAGGIARSFAKAWDGLKVDEGQPNRVTLSKSGLKIRTELDNAVISLDLPETLEVRSKAVADAVGIWRSCLRLEVFKRVSMRVDYVKNFPTPVGAREAIRKLGLVNWPTQKVFGQDEAGEKDGLDCALRFEDASTFTVVRARTESVVMDYEIHPDFSEGTPKIHKELHRIVIDFDRGTVQPMRSSDLSVEEWMKGYFHVLRRDLPKVVSAGAI